MIHNKKGMTLIEILVVLVISSLVMVIAASLILNGLGYFNKTASGDVDKRVSDTISTYVRDELIYASNVRISTTKPEDNENEWHSLAINKNGYLEKDDEQLYQEDYYNHKILKLEANTYGDTYRLDLKFSLMEGKKVKYTTSTTLELINIKTKILDIGKGEEKALSEKMDISYDSGYKIYYQTGHLGISDVEDVPPTEIQGGTVGDESKCKNENNTKEWWSGTGSVKYKKDTFVEYNGKLYRAIMDVKDNGSNPADNQKGYWKLIDSVFHATSSYLKGDVIEHPKGSDVYYICIKNIYNHDMTPGTAQGNGYWESIKKEDINIHKYDYCTMGNDKTVAGEYGRCPQGDIVEWKNVTKLTSGMYVRFNGDVYRYIGMHTLTTDLVLVQPNMNKSSRDYWKRIDVNFDKFSSYYKGDIVFDQVDGKYYTLIQEWARDGVEPHVLEAWQEVEDIDKIEAPGCRSQWW